jgi:hypothetical protein
MSTQPPKPRKRTEWTREQWIAWLERFKDIEEPDCMFMAISPEIYAEMKKDPIYGPLLEAEAAELKSEQNQS